MRLLISKILVILFLFSGFLYVTGKMADPDLGWHLKAGEQVMNDKAVPRFDQFSWTMNEFEWIDHEWLVDAWLAWMRNKGFWAIIVFLFAISAATPFFIWVWKSKNWAHLLIVILAAATMIPFIGIRPQIISFLLFFLVFEILAGFAVRNKRFGIILLPLIFFVWANLHAGFFAGLVILGLFTLTLMLKSGYRNNHRPVLLFAVSILSVGVTFINPYGGKIYKEIFTVILSSSTMRYISEWLPIFSNFDISLIIFFGIFSAFLLRFYKKYSLPILAVSIFLFLASLKSARNFPLFLATAMPFLFFGVDLASEEIKIARKEKPFDKKTKMILSRIIVGMFVLATLLFGWRLYDYEAMRFPEVAVQFMRNKVKNGQWREVKLFNDYGFGGYLIDNIPEVKVFIDGRMPHWISENGNSAMKDYIKISYYDKSSDWREVFERRGINAVLIKNSGAEFKNNLAQKYVPNLLKNFLKKEKTAAIIRLFLGDEKSRNLRSELSESGWRVEYEDESASILRK